MPPTDPHMHSDSVAQSAEYRYYLRMTELSSRQRKLLEKYAQVLQSVVIVGRNGVTEAVEKTTDAALADHELIKISFNEFKDEKRDLASSLAQACGAVLVRVIGNKAVLYRPAEKSGDRKYEKALEKIKGSSKNLSL